jgi:hypothetical protein
MARAAEKAVREGKLGYTLIVARKEGTYGQAEMDRAAGTAHR